MFKRNSIVRTALVGIGLALFPCFSYAAEFGIAAKYAQDKNLAYDPDVIAFWDYEDGEDFRYGWVGGLNYYKRIATPGGVFLGAYGLEAQLYQGTNGSGDRMILENPETCLYQRWYCKLEPGFTFAYNGLKTHGFAGFGPGYNSGTPQGSAGSRPTGADKFYAIVLPFQDSRPGLYFYHLDQAGGWGDAAAFGEPLGSGSWVCYEIMVKLNDPSLANGELKCWVNGNMSYSRTNLRWRTSPDLKINLVLDHVYNEVVKNQKVFFDNRVIARRYIGPASGTGPNSPPIPANPQPASPDTKVPVVTNLFPVANATGVAAKTLITFHIKDDRGVDSTTVVLKVNGQAVKPKITGFQRDFTVTYPNPIGYASGSVVSVAINAKDVSGNSMPTYNYSFTIAGTPGIAGRIPVAMQQKAGAGKKVYNIQGRTIKHDGRAQKIAHELFVEHGSGQKAKMRVSASK